MREIIASGSNSGWPATGHWPESFLDANSADGVVGEFAERVVQSGCSPKSVTWYIVITNFRIVSQQHFPSPDSQTRNFDFVNAAGLQGGSRRKPRGCSVMSPPLLNVRHA